MQGDQHKAYFDTYNKQAEQKLRKACKFHGIPFEMCQPKTIKGVKKLLGVWDYEGRYTRFKTLGAKRYMVEQENALKTGGKSYPVSLTVSGVNKNVLFPTLWRSTGKTAYLTHLQTTLICPRKQQAKTFILT